MLQRFRGANHFKESGIPLLIKREEWHGITPLHVHDFAEIVIVYNGNSEYFTRTKRYTISAGDIFVVNKNEVHGYDKSNEDFSIYNILFDPDKLRLPAWNIDKIPIYRMIFPSGTSSSRTTEKCFLRLNENDFSEIINLADKTGLEIRNKSIGYEAMAASFFCQLIILISRGYEKTKEVDKVSPFKLSAAINHIETNFTGKIRLKELAAKIGLSQSTFQRYFKHALNSSPIDYLNRFRIKKATEFLMDSTLSISEAGHKAGFDDSNYFSRRFQAIMGMGPRQYRNNIRLQRHAKTSHKTDKSHNVEPKQRLAKT